MKRRGDAEMGRRSRQELDSDCNRTQFQASESSIQKGLHTHKHSFPRVLHVPRRASNTGTPRVSLSSSVIGEEFFPILKECQSLFSFSLSFSFGRVVRHRDNRANLERGDCLRLRGCHRRRTFLAYRGNCLDPFVA